MCNKGNVLMAVCPDCGVRVIGSYPLDFHPLCYDCGEKVYRRSMEEIRQERQRREVEESILKNLVYSTGRQDD
jgi:predicted  nucleic acid-binding Zn-ribbon protein